MENTAKVSYEKLLLGHRERMVFKVSGEDRLIAEYNAKEVLRYAFEVILNWTPQDIRDYVTIDILKWLNIIFAYRKLTFPPELDPDIDVSFLAHLLYPKEIVYSRRDIVINKYNQVLSGTLAKFPKNFFSENEGQKNLEICFRYAVFTLLPDMTEREMYEYFSDKIRSDKFLKNSRLEIINKNHIDIIDYLHSLISDENSSDFWYIYYKFRFEADKTRKEIG